MNRRQSSDTSPTGRHEPRLGNVDQLGVPEGPVPITSPPRRSGPPPARRPLTFWLLWLLILGMTVATVWCYQDQLRALIPSTTLNQVLNRGDQALQAGHLDGHDGSSARELYEAARALAPDNDRAMQGLRQVASAELDASRQALAAGRLDEAEQALAVARELNGGGVIIEQLQRDINARRSAGDQLERWVQQAQAALAAGHLDGDGGAGPLYRQMLTMNPDNPVAQHGLDQVASAMTAQARQAIAAHDLAAAADWVSRLVALNPDYAELPVLKGELVDQQQAAAQQLQADLDKAGQALRDGRISGASPDTAQAGYQAALVLDPQNAQAKAGLAQVAAALIMQADAALEAGDSRQARALLDQAAPLAPDSPELNTVRAQLQDDGRGDKAAVAVPPPVAASAALPAARIRAPTPTQAVAELSPAQQAQVAQWLQQAGTAAAAGQIMLPPGASAYDLYRQVLATDPHNAAAQAGLQGLPAAARQALVVAMGSGQLGQAEGLLASLGQLQPGDASLGVMREQLANAWIDQAIQQLDAGDKPGCAQALHHARQLSPRNPRLPGLYAHLNAAR